MTTIYRLEMGEAGKGVYYDRSKYPYVSDILDNHNCFCDYRCPSIFADLKDSRGLLLVPSYIYFGFDTIEKLLAWFPAECIEDLIEIAGAKLVVYETEETVRLGNKQCLFHKFSATKVHEFDRYNQVKEHLRITN